MSAEGISSTRGMREWHTKIKACSASGLLRPRPPSIGYAIVRLPGHNLTIQMSYTLSEEPATASDTFLPGYTSISTKGAEAR